MEILCSTSGKTTVQVAREVSLKAGDSLVRQFHQERRISFKGRGKVVTDVDKEVESEPSRKIIRKTEGMPWGQPAQRRAQAQ